MAVSPFDQRPLIVAIAGSNGAGKSTFYHVHLRPAGLRFVNADVIARELDLEPYAAAKVADALRRELVNQRESFVFETVFSDPVGDKIGFLKDAITAGYTVVLCFIGIASPGISEERVAMRVSQGGHGVPTEKLHSRHRSYGDSSTVTLSPGRIRIKCMRIFPPIQYTLSTLNGASWAMPC